MNESIVDLNVNLWTIGFTIFNAIVLFLIMRKLLFTPVMNFIESRKNFIQGEIENADHLKHEAAALRDEYDNRLAGIEDEKRKIIEEARKMSSYMQEKTRKDAELEKERILKSAEIERSHLYEKAKQDLRKETAILSVDIAEEILRKKIDNKDNEQILEDILGELSDIKV